MITRSVDSSGLVYLNRPDGSVCLGFDRATPIQHRNQTERYCLVSARTNKTVMVHITGKTGRTQYLRVEGKRQHRVLSSSSDRQILYTHLYLYTQYVFGHLKRRNLFKNVEEKFVPLDPIERLMQEIGYEITR